MTPENVEAFNRLVSVMTGDYAELLIRGEVLVRTDDPSGWRTNMRKSARLDRLKIHTGRSDRDPRLVWAIRLRNDDNQPADDETLPFKTLTYQHHVQAMARANGHTLDRWLIHHEGQAAGRCEACGGRAYVDATGDIPIVDGDVIDDHCSSCASSSLA